jgi:CheY-like chemotaxis protein/HPt (histidine-containing phosphotransfer) domain-containing protein
MHLIMLTSVGNYGDAELAERAGIEMYLCKPVRQSRLYNGLVSMVGKKTISAGTKGDTVVESFRQFSARILLVEDNPVNQELGLAMLGEFGCRVDLAGNGRKALEATAHTAYDLVFMDCQMPEMDGFAATRAIRAREGQSGGHSTIVALTAHAMKGDREGCLAAGMDDYLSKPFKMEDLDLILERWLGEKAGAAQEGSTAATAGTKAALHRDTEAVGQHSGLAVKPVAGEGPLDQKALDVIRALESNGKTGVLHRVLDLFLINSPDLLKSMRRGIVDADSVSVYHSAHTLKSSCAMVGAMTLAEVCKEMEMKGKINSLENAYTLLCQIESEYDVVQNAIKIELDNCSV